MTAKTPKVKVGEDWAYREKASSPLVPVLVIRIGTGLPLRVRVRFVDDEFEGREEWVLASRLKVRWEDVANWQAREAKWDAVRAASDHVADTAEYWAVDMVFNALAELKVSQGYGRTSGVMTVPDIDALAARLDLEVTELTSDLLSFVDDDGTFVVPWTVTERVARRAAPLLADQILAEVARLEARARQRARYGEHHKAPHGGGSYTGPEVCAEVDRRSQPAYNLVRQWCGTELVDRYDELEALREEVLRVGQIAERAIHQLETAGAKRAAKALRQEPGVPVETLRASEGHQAQRRGSSGP